MHGQKKPFRAGIVVRGASEREVTLENGKRTHQSRSCYGSHGNPGGVSGQNFVFRPSVHSGQSWTFAPHWTKSGKDIRRRRLYFYRTLNEFLTIIVDAAVGLNEYEQFYSSAEIMYFFMSNKMPLCSTIIFTCKQNLISGTME